MTRTAGWPQRLQDRARADRADSGFTLLEVIVAVVLLTAISLTAAGFMTRSVATSAGYDGRQAAVTVSRQVMEEVRAVPATFTTSSSGQSSSTLVQGRSKTDSVAAWTAAGVTTTDTYTGSGTTTFDQHAYTIATGASVNPVVPFTKTEVVDNRTYTVRTLIGTCTRVRTTGVCDKTGTGDELFRVVVVVTWTDRTCATPAACRYELATLIDPAQQPTFNTLRRPVAYDDPDDGLAAITVPAGTSYDIGVVGNDSGYFPVSGGVEVAQSPLYGSATPKAGGNLITYAAPTNYSGPVSFLYAATDTNGNRSNSAVVRLTVLPRAVADTIPTTTKTTVLNVIGNDQGSLSGATIAIASGPSAGASATVSGTSVNFVAPNASARTYSFTYTVRDATGGVSEPATVSVTVNAPAAPTATDFSVSASGSGTVTIPLTSRYTPSTATLATNKPNAVLNGTSVNFTPTRTSSGAETFTYTATDTWGRSATATVTVNLTFVNGPRAPSFTIDRSNSGDFTINPSDYGITWTGAVTITETSNRASVGYIVGFPYFVLDGPARGDTYTVSYTVTDSTGQSATGTITVRRP